jgi:hypothetical protein
MHFEETKEFKKEFKKLLKKYRTLESDFVTLKEFLSVYPKGYDPRIVRVSNVKVVVEIYKVRHFPCRALKNRGSRSGIRVIYAYKEEDGLIHFSEMYYKERDNSDCDKQRILDYFG